MASIAESKRALDGPIKQAPASVRLDLTDTDVAVGGFVTPSSGSCDELDHLPDIPMEGDETPPSSAETGTKLVSPSIPRNKVRDAAKGQHHFHLNHAPSSPHRTCISPIDPP
mmetsp:Transcript_2377/g.6189  ORF Transcript_2377/g.6189 Transcript_2377/m.6189 type:complete len:112 (+) Transcript_2377:74-409(+)